MPDDPTDEQPSDSGSFRARVRNESTFRADVTLRFIRDSITVHLAFIRVLPKTVTTVTSPEPAAMVEVSGTDDGGRALPASALPFEVQTGGIQMVEYVVGASPTPSPPTDPPDDRPVPVNPPIIELLEPTQNLSVRLGGSFDAQWRDASEVSSTVVRIGLRNALAADDSAFLPLGPAVGAALDGLNDRLSVVVQAVEPGLYDVVAEIDDGTRQTTSVAPGRVEITRDPGNTAPILSILSPTSMVERRAGELLSVQWSDDDADDNATISFALVPTDSGAAGTGSFAIGPALAEDPDGGSADRAVLVLADVLPGLYDLVGTITDGELSGTARAAGAVRIQPAPGNDIPTLTLLAPFVETTVEAEGAFLVRWLDSDENDNARISLLLDPDVSSVALNGNEVLLAASLGEDLDGSGDEITLGVPAGVPSGDYAVVGLITDGVSEIVTRAPGIVFVSERVPSDRPGDDPNPTQIRRIHLAEPALPVWTRLGDTIPLRLQLVNLPSSAAVKLFISGVSDDGEYLRADVTPVGFQVNVDTQLRLPATGGAIPNKWWPRQFTLEADVVHENVRYHATAAGPIWIRQEVAIRSARMINYWCWDQGLAVPAATDFFGLEIDWYGGGFGDDPSGASATAGFAGPVRFWLSGDGLIPASDVEDSAHRVILQTVENPNVVRTDRAHYTTLIGIDPEDLLQPPSDLDPALDNNVYRILAVTETDLFGRLVTGPDLDPIEVCFPLPIAAGP